MTAEQEHIISVAKRGAKGYSGNISVKEYIDELKLMLIFKGWDEDKADIICDKAQKEIEKLEDKQRKR